MKSQTECDDSLPLLIYWAQTTFFIHSNGHPYSVFGVVGNVKFQKPVIMKQNLINTSILISIFFYPLE